MAHVGGLVLSDELEAVGEVAGALGDVLEGVGGLAERLR